MADLPKSNNTQYAYLSQLSVDELMELLVNAPVPASTPEEEAYVEALKEAIIKKENVKPTGTLPDVDKAWAEFQENCEFLEEAPLSDLQEGPGSTVKSTNRPSAKNPSPAAKPKPRRRLRQVLVAAAIVVCLVVFALPPALGYESFFKMLGEWTSDTFYFTPNTQPTGETQTGEFPPPKEYQNLQEALDDYGVTEQLVPAWIPDGYVLEEVSVRTSPVNGKVEFRAVYEDGEALISVLYVKRSTLASSTYERDETEVEIYEKGGIQHYIFENLGQFVCAWYHGNIECSIGLDTSREDLKKMIDSIYEV